MKFLIFFFAFALCCCRGLGQSPEPVSSGTLQQATVMPEVDVVEKLNEARDSIVPSLGATSYSIPASQIQVQSQGDNAPINQTILRAPGVAEDSFGQLHVRGEHNNLEFRINGILLPEGITGFGMEFDSRFIQSVNLIDGALPGAIWIQDRRHHRHHDEGWLGKRRRHRLLLRRQQQPPGAIVPVWRRQWEMDLLFRRAIIPTIPSVSRIPRQ